MVWAVWDDDYTDNYCVLSKQWGFEGGIFSLVLPQLLQRSVLSSPQLLLAVVLSLCFLPGMLAIRGPHGTASHGSPAAGRWDLRAAVSVFPLAVKQLNHITPFSVISYLVEHWAFLEQFH